MLFTTFRHASIVAALLISISTRPCFAHWYLDGVTTTFERAVRCTVLLNIRNGARWSGDTEAMIRIILGDPTLQQRAADLSTNSPNYGLGRSDPPTLAKAMIAVSFNESLELLFRQGADLTARLPPDADIRRTCQALAREYG